MFDPSLNNARIPNEVAKGSRKDLIGIRNKYQHASGYRAEQKL
jgi:hypothetical protein